jgi:hypothetical protein
MTVKLDIHVRLNPCPHGGNALLDATIIETIHGKHMHFGYSLAGRGFKELHFSLEMAVTLAPG